MALPTQYTEEALANYMLDVLGDLAAVLGLDFFAASEAVTDALLLSGVGEIAQAVDIGRLRAAARLAIWRQANARAVGLYAFTADGATYNRQQVAAQVRAALLYEEAAAADAGIAIGGVWATTGVMRVADPYRVPADDAAQGVG